MTEDQKTAQAEGSYAAKSGEVYLSNPYPMDHTHYNFWAAGWISAMEGIQIEIRLVKITLNSVIKDRREVQAKLDQVQAEYDAFLIEQGY